MEFRTVLSRKVDKAYNRCCKAVGRLEDASERAWAQEQQNPEDKEAKKAANIASRRHSKAEKLLSKVPDRTIDVYDHLGFYPPNLVKFLKRRKVDSIVFLAPDDEEILLFFGSEETALRKLQELEKKIKAL